jgi:uncharacterized membrane protein
VIKVSDIASMGFRMQPELKEWLRTEAKKNCRTMNTEMIFILEKEKALRASTPKALDMNAQTSI